MNQIEKSILEENTRLRLAIEHLTDNAYAKEVDNVLGLPVPRLEIEWLKLDDAHDIAHYRLVIKREFRSGEAVIVQVPFGWTKRHMRSERTYNEDDLPLRDGVHIKLDAKTLGLPAFVIAEGKAYQIDTETR